MRKKEKAKRLGALLLSVLMIFGSTFGTYAAQPAEVQGVNGQGIETLVSTEPQQPAAQMLQGEGGAYSLNFTTASGITIVPDKESYAEGDMVSFTITNTSGNEITGVTVSWEEDESLEVTKTEETYSFIMPAGDVFISVTTFVQTVNVNAFVENASAVFDKSQYVEGDEVKMTITPNSGYVLIKENVTVQSGGSDVEFTAAEEGGGLVVTFVLPNKDVDITAKAVKAYELTFSYKDMYGADGSSLFEVSVNPEKLLEGTDVSVSIEYKGSIGWMAEVTGVEEYEMTSDSFVFTMPAENVHIALEEMEEYDKGDLSGEDTLLGEDIGKQHDVTTKNEYEPDISIGKSAKWEDIEEGLAELILTEKDTSDWSDNPSDYIIILDRTRTMAIDDKCFWSENDSDIGLTHSVCWNPQHFYYYRNQTAQLIDYQNGRFEKSGETFHISSKSSTKLWQAHYNASGARITPSIANGCIDRLTLAQKGIKDIMDVLDSQNKKELAGGLKNRVMYWSFSGPTWKDLSLHPDGVWNEVPSFTSDIAAAKSKVKYEAYAGTYYNNSFDKVLASIRAKQSDPDYKDIPTKVIFISDGVQSDADKAYTTNVTNQIKALPNTKIYTILIGNAADSEAGRLLKKYANDGCFATVNQNWDTYTQTITAIQRDQYEIGAVEKVLTDKINTEYWEVVGEPILEAGNGTASLNSSKTVLTWNIPAGEGKTYTCKLKLKLKDEYRYLISDNKLYPTNLDDGNPTDEDIKNNPDKAGAVLNYNITGGKYNNETRKVGIRTPKLKYGAVEFEGEKIWTVDGSSADSVRISLKRTMPGSSTATEVNNATVNVTNEWRYKFDVRRMPDGTTYPLIKYNNAGVEVDYEVTETVPAYYKQVEKKETVGLNGKVTTQFYNEPYKLKAQVVKVDEDTKNPLSGAQFSVYAWSKKENTYVPYKGTNTSMAGASSVVMLKEGEKGVYTTPVWLYYSSDNMGRFRIIETKAPEGYFGDWKNDNVTDSDADKNYYDFSISQDEAENGQTVTVSNTENGKFDNQRVKGEILFEKHDKEAKEAKAQGDATLVGAVYKLYAAEDIVHQDQATGVLFAKDEEIKVSLVSGTDGLNVYKADKDGNAQITIGEALKVCIKDLELGKYYVKEVSASEGYLVDTNKYYFDLVYADEKTEIVKEEGVVYEPVKKQALSFYKMTADDNADQLDPMKGARFSVYLVSALQNGRYKKLSDADVVQAVIDDLRNESTLLYDTYKEYAPAVIYAEASDADVQNGKLVKTTEYPDGISYTAEGENAYYVAELESDDKGIVKTPALPYGRYVVIETKTPNGKTATRPFIINVKADDNDKEVEGDGKGTPLQDIQLTLLIDRPIKSLIRLMKRDSQSKNAVLKEGAAYVIHDIEGAWYDYITNEMTTEQKEAYKAQFGDLVAQYSQGVYFGTKEDPFVTKVVKTSTNEYANVYIETPMQLPSGTYELEEIIAPEGYVLQGFEGVIAKDKSADGNGTFYEKEEDGAWEPTPQGRKRFTVSSLEAVYDETTMSFVTVVKQDNDPAVGKISIYVDGEALTNAEKGEDDYEFSYDLRPVEGAKFEIHAAEDIYSQEGGVNAVKLFSKGDLVVTLTSDENGQTWTGQEDWDGTDIAKGLPLGKYTVTQTAAGRGFYLSDENKAPREISITYAGQEVPVIYRDTAYTNPRQNVKVEVIKTDIETGEKLAGAVFGLFAKDDIVNYDKDIVVKADELVAVAKTESIGGEIKNAVFAPDLPLGRYYVKELQAPHGYLLNKNTYDVDASYAPDSVKTIEKSCKVKNQISRLIFTKSDIESGRYIAGAQFEIYEILTDNEGNLLKDENGEYMLSGVPSASWTSKSSGEELNYFYEKDGVRYKLGSAEELPEGMELITIEGHLVEGLITGKQYILREAMAPEMYVGYEASSDETKEANRILNDVSEEMRFEVTDTADIVTYDVKDQRVVGDIIITKEGEFLTSAEVSVIDSVKNLVSTAFKYLLGRVENVTFEISVREDIYEPDGSGNIAVWENSDGEPIELKEGTVLAIVKTDRNGIAGLYGLPLGTYSVKESSAGDMGDFLLDTNERIVTLSYAGQDIPVVGASDVETVYFLNERQKVNINLFKYRTAADGKKVPVEGALFGLFTAEDLFGYTVAEDMTVIKNAAVIIEADTLIETLQSDKDGYIRFNREIPGGKYYVKEITPADGYLRTDFMAEIDATFTGENGDKTLVFELEAENIITSVGFRKKDLATGENLSGAALAVIEKETGEVVTEWLSGKDRNIVEGLKLSGEKENIYILRELKPADGYVTAEDIEFKLVQNMDESGCFLGEHVVLVRDAEESGEWTEVSEKTVEMFDDVTKVQINKIDKELGILITGAELELLDSRGKKVTTWTSSEDDGFYIEKLPVGTYTIVESKQPAGYKKAEKLTIEVKDTADTQVFVFENISEGPRLDVEKSTIDKTKLGAAFEYEIDTVKNLLPASMDNFTLTDTLPEEVELKELYTGTYSHAGTIKVEFKTASNRSWRVWKDGISTLRSEKLSVDGLGLLAGERVTAFRLSFGTVEAGFKNITDPVYIVKVVEKGDKELKNDITLTGTKMKFTFIDEDITITVLEEEPAPPKTPEQPKPPVQNTAPKTGDVARIGLMFSIAGAALAGMVVLARKSSRHKEDK